MARLATSSRPPRPQLVGTHHQQLPTPVSTTTQPSTNNAAASSLTARYTRHLQSAPTPPARVESLDLTGDVKSESSLSFGDAQVLWKAGATPAETGHEPRGRKRKSDERFATTEREQPSKIIKSSASDNPDEDYDDIFDDIDMISPPEQPPSIPETSQPTPLTPSSTIGSDDQKLLKLCLDEPAQISQALVVLADELKRKKDEYWALCEAEAPREAQKLQMKALQERQKDLLQIQTLCTDHVERATKHRALKERFMAALDTGEDSDSLEDAVVQSSKGTRNVEKDIIELLKRSRIEDLGFGSQLPDPTASHSRPDIDVPATASSSGSVRPARQTMASSSSVNVDSRIIRQTQVPRAYTSLPMTPVPFASTSTPIRHRSVERRPDRYLQESRRPRLQPSRSVVEDIDEFPIDYELEEESIMQDARLIRRASSKTDVAEDYGISDDDNEMLDFVDDFETQTASSKSVAAPQPRKALREIQSNSVTATAKQAPTVKSMYSHVDERSEWLNLPWTKDVKLVLRDRFKLRGFRQNQLETINATLAGEDVFVLMPTGGGKSLCYQLPALVQSGKTRGITVVVSPLLSLMQDQWAQLRKKHIFACQLTSETTAEDKRKTYSGLRERDPEQFVEILYVTPEALTVSEQLRSALMNLHRRGKLARFVIDEAHCVSQWGHDFRQDYMGLGQLRETFPGVPFMALTATATENCKTDVMFNLGMQGCKVFTQSFNRPNLRYEVRAKKSKSATLDTIAQLIDGQYRGQCGIIYTLSRKSCEEIAKELREKYNISAYHYHAGMPVQDEQPKKPGEKVIKGKVTVQREWQSGRYKVIVATIAFGMGIDKPDVRFVVHFSLPKNIEGYYQETGRAGRDGNPSGCYLFYGYQDVVPLKSFIEKDEKSSYEQQQRQYKMLQRMVAFAENDSLCRRVEILNYFSEQFDRANCNGTCDNCSSKTQVEMIDYTSLAKAAIKIVKRVTSRRTDGQLTIAQCAELLTKTKPTPDFEYKRIPLACRFEVEDMAEVGSFKTMHKGEVEKILYRLFAEHALKEYNKVNKAGFPTSYVELGDKYGDILKGRRDFKMQVRVTTGSTAREGKSAVAKKKTKSGTGVAAARKNAQPQSTNVSSPVRPKATTRRKVPAVAVDEFVVDDSDAMDSFIDDDTDADDGDLDEHGIGGVRWAGAPSKPVKSLGQPITNDARIDGAQLDQCHLSLLDDFVADARKIEAEIKLNKTLSRNLFTHLQYREMAIRWTTTIREMQAIDGIDLDKVKRYGSEFLPLVNEYHATYRAMVASDDEDDEEEETREVLAAPFDPNHRLVIDLDTSDDEFGDGADEIQQASHHFNPRVKQFQEGFQATARQSPVSDRPDTPPPRPSERVGRGSRATNHEGGSARESSAKRKFGGWKTKKATGSKASSGSTSRKSSGNKAGSSTAARKPGTNAARERSAPSRQGTINKHSFGPMDH